LERLKNKIEEFFINEYLMVTEHSIGRRPRGQAARSQRRRHHRSSIINNIKLKRILAPRSESRTLSAKRGEASSPEALKMNANRSKKEPQEVA